MIRLRRLAVPAVTAAFSGVLALQAVPAEAATVPVSTIDALDSPVGSADALNDCIEQHLNWMALPPAWKISGTDCAVTWEKTSMTNGYTSPHAVGDKVVNLNPTSARQAITWSDTTTTTDTYTTSVSAKTTLFNAVDITLTETYGHSYSKSNTVSETNTMEILPCYWGQWVRQAPTLEFGGATTLSYKLGGVATKSQVVINNSNVTMPDPDGVGVLTSSGGALEGDDAANCVS
ncbi:MULTISPECIES: hypothetical protein [unclassified Streptomyces]|uniref:hypothetical protein n=1 Tax=unclassified Streptomyces TaxID=2593676 RepID=UPI001F03D8EF|nr:MULTISPECIES: hypothetical protein [unclassified Streptomyces]MCH0561804.1 hypothetical protein [Streptomyces sp. MUM 2J]MCH0571587.1 hypothetical protein [Streptomyces sp. MUM 136J]